MAPAPPEAVPDLFEGLSPSPDAKRASRDDASALAVRATRAEHEAAKLRDEVERLRARADEASRAERTAREERDVLLENISKLYATARDEIVRKDEELKRLRDRCVEGTRQRGRPLVFTPFSPLQPPSIDAFPSLSSVQGRVSGGVAGVSTTRSAGAASAAFAPRASAPRAAARG